MSDPNIPTPQRISSVLVANRGEIARRVFRTCRDLGIATVAVHSDVDAEAPHVREADAAVRLPGATAAETYLRADLIVEAARRAGADAVHPGYGFLSENADFARAVEAAGLTWIGPPPKAIDAMGSKIEAKRIMADAGVPVLEQLDPASLDESRLPVLVKASAGGGGRGMRIVHTLDALPGEVEAARSEAASAFGDSTVFCEPYLATAHHVEVQIMADRHGTVWAVGERECSLQRRHQKVVEEAPAPLVERLPSIRKPLYDAAIAATTAIGYEGAGTVEFLVDDEGRFFFLETNTRLQVEHPVTELTTGLDLVALQIDVARGRPLPARQPETSGAAIEVRLYAEDPAQDWQPQSGILDTFEIPGAATEFGALAGAGVRVDAGVESGSAVSVFYDPMLAKVMAWAPERADAAAALAATLRRARVHGLRTNRDLLVRVLEHEAFVAGRTDTAFFDTHDLATLARPLADPDVEAVSAVAAALADAAQRREQATVQPGLPLGWRNLRSQWQRVGYLGPAGEHDVGYRVERGMLGVEGRDDLALVSLEPDRVVLEIDGVRRAFTIARGEGPDRAAVVHVDSPLGPVTLTVLDRFPDPTDTVAPGSLVAPLPGVVTSVAVGQDEHVRTGQPLLVLEAMKMQHTIAAQSDGLVTALPVEVGQQVEVGTVLAVVTDSGDDTSRHEEALP